MLAVASIAAGETMERIALISSCVSDNLENNEAAVDCNRDHCGPDCVCVEHALQCLDIVGVQKYNKWVRQPRAVKARAPKAFVVYALYLSRRSFNVGGTL